MSAELDIAVRVIELVRDRAGSGVDAEAVVERDAFALTRFANSFIHQNVADESAMVWLRLHADGRTAGGSTNRTDADGLADLVSRTVEAVRLAPADPAWPGLAPPAPLTGAPDFDPATAAASPAERAERVRAFVDAAGGLTTAGYCRTLDWASAFANSAGQSVECRTSDASMDGIARLDGCDGVARIASSRLSDVDGAVLGARAAAKARAGTGAVELPPGRYEVVMEPGAVADLLFNLALYGFNGKAFVERRSFVELGAGQLDPSVTLVDDPLAAGRVGRSFDGEGTPKRRQLLVEAGVSTAMAHDRRTAAQAGGGAESTGHALPGGGSPWGAFPLHLSLVPGTGEPGTGEGPVDPAAAGLVSNLERGLLVTDLHYTRVLDPRTLVVTGLTRNGVWLIEDGKATTPVQNLRFTQSYPEALGPGQVLGIGTTVVPIPDSWVSACWSAPALHLGSWNFTGGASG
jgi:predicted Zn-dependent protease